LTIEEIKEKLETIPDKIRTVRERLNGMNLTEDAELALKNIEAEHLLTITSEKDNGKPKFSNEGMRQAELKRRMESDENATKQRQRIREGQRAKREGETEVEFLYNQFKAAQALAKLECALIGGNE